MANEYTLADYEMQQASTITKAVVRTWREASPIMEMLRFQTKNQLEVPFIRWNTLPSVPYRNIGDSFTQAKVDPQQIKERPYYMGAKIDIAKEYVLADPTTRTNQEKAVALGLACAFNESFINGLPGDQKEPIGLWHRLVNDFAAAQSVDGGALDMSPDGAGTTKALFNLIEDGLSRLDSINGMGSDVVMIMNREMKLALESAMRNSGLLQTTVDQIGRKFTTYGNGGPKILDIGYDYTGTAPIIDNDELANGSAITGHDCTSIYFVKIGDAYLQGFQQFPVTVRDVGLLEDNVTFRTVIDWAPGFSVVHPRAIARIYGLMAE